ncbi:histidine phosphatase family protein [Streptosporangium sp. NBC_01810]|uniref:histidine phosphatase family protein n=1 Tax=Streptosporangium sp. NBC_01810 TaxID=2975951 RepID=UPI002DDC8090|nr:histidine phosphatase family protein [Streptosporangium sp. NBC_01810]WSA25412.1 histidine phosphatase family protein [Streptosporangium sp. NBC_01810]
MVISYLVRHGRTAYSATYRLNGDPRVPVGLDGVGRRQCRMAATRIGAVTSCVTSGLPRARQSAALLLGGRQVPITVDARLNELHYGQFEGKPFMEYARWLEHEGPWRRPPEGVESQREGIRRMLDGIRAATVHPGPRLTVTHGLAVSVLLWCQANASVPLTDMFFPEAPYATAWGIPDEELIALTDQRVTEIDMRLLIRSHDGPRSDRAPSAELLPSGPRHAKEEEDSHA